MFQSRLRMVWVWDHLPRHLYINKLHVKLVKWHLGHVLLTKQIGVHLAHEKGICLPHRKVFVSQTSVGRLTGLLFWIEFAIHNFGNIFGVVKNEHNSNPIYVFFVSFLILNHKMLLKLKLEIVILLSKYLIKFIISCHSWLHFKIKEVLTAFN